MNILPTTPKLPVNASAASRAFSRHSYKAGYLQNSGIQPFVRHEKVDNITINARRKVGIAVRNGPKFAYPNGVTSKEEYTCATA